MARILIAEDDLNMLKLINYRLQHLGHDVLWAFDGEQALAREARPELILRDVMMPVRHGFEVLREGKTDRRTATISVIIVSTRGRQHEMAEASADGAHSGVAKLCNFPLLVDRINHALNPARCSFPRD